MRAAGARGARPGPRAAAAAAPRRRPRAPRAARAPLRVRAAEHADYAPREGDSSVLHLPLKQELPPEAVRAVFGYARDLEARYELGAVLGAGSFGVVRAARERATGRRFAVKTIPKRPKSGRCTPRYLLKLQTEVRGCGGGGVWVVAGGWLCGWAVCS
jgi:hypothetical protein